MESYESIVKIVKFSCLSYRSKRDKQCLRESVGIAHVRPTYGLRCCPLREVNTQRRGRVRIFHLRNYITDFNGICYFGSTWDWRYLQQSISNLKDGGRKFIRNVDPYLLSHMGDKSYKTVIFILKFVSRISFGSFWFKGSNAVGIEIGYGSDDRGVKVRFPVGSRIFTSPCHPDRFWGPLNFLSNGKWSLFPRG
jgi:hypothetical protein